MNKKRSTPPNPAAAAREAAQRKARDERQQNQGSPEHRRLPEGVPYRDPVSPLEERFNPMRQALPEPPSLRLPPIYGPPPRQQPGPSHHQLPQSLPPPPQHEALPPPLPQRLPPIPPIPPRQQLPQSDSVGQSHEIPHFLPPPPCIGRLEGNQHRRIIQWLGVSPQNPIVLISLLTRMHLSFQSTLIEKSILILMTCTIQTLSRVTSMTLCHGMTSLLSLTVSFPLCLCPTPSPSPSNPIQPHPPAFPLRKVNMCKYPPIGSIIILPDDVYKSSKIMLPKEGLCL